MIISVDAKVARVVDTREGMLEVTVDYRDQDEIILRTEVSEVVNDPYSIMVFKGAVKSNLDEVLNAYNATGEIREGDIIS